MFDFLLKVVECFFREDEPDLITFEDAEPLIREVIPSLYSWGEINSETYLLQMCAVLGIEDLLDVEQYARLSIQDLLDLCAAVHAYGRYVDAVAILRSQEQRLRGECDDLTLLGNCKKLEGQSFLALAEWGVAESALLEGMELYERAGDEPLALRGRAHSLLLLGDLFLLSGQTGKCEAIFDDVHSFVNTMGDRLEQDVLSTSYAHHFLARIEAADHFRENYDWHQEMTYPLSELAKRMSSAEVEQVGYRISQMAQGASEVLDSQDKTRKEYGNGDYIRESHDLAYDHTLISGLVSAQGMGETFEYYKQDGDLAVDALLRIRAEVARAKVLAMHDLGKAIEVSFQPLAECAALLDGFYAAYWSTEYLATYCVLYAAQGLPNVDQVVADLRDSYTQIGRMDRFEHLRRSLDALQEGDKLRFKREFAYMLTF